MAREVGDAQRTLTDLTGQPPRWFRSVVGMTNPFVAAPLKRHGLARVAWNARGFDAVRDDQARIAADIERDLAPGAIILMHEGAPHGRSVEMVEAVLRCLRANGYATVLPDDGKATSAIAAKMEGRRGSPWRDYRRHGRRR